VRNTSHRQNNGLALGQRTLGLGSGELNSAQDLTYTCMPIVLLAALLGKKLPGDSQREETYFHFVQEHCSEGHICYVLTV